MKKVLPLLSILLALAVLLCACDSMADQGPKATVSIKEGTLTDTGFVYVIENETEEYVFQFGAGYIIEQWGVFGWSEYHGPHSQNVIAIKYVILPGVSEEFTANWERVYGELPPGRYRLVKGGIERTEYDGRNNDTLDGEYDLYLEFTI